MPVGGGGFVDRVLELEAVDDVVRAHREDLADAFRDLAVGHVDLGGAVGVDVESDGFGFADGVGHLDEHLVAETGGHQVLGDVAGGVGSRAIDFRGVFAGESAAAVCTASTVGVDDDFASRESCVTVRTADNELAGRVYKQLVLCVEQFRYAQQREMLEIPAGKLERGEDPFETGKRELQEETGYKAEHWTFLGEFIPTGAYLEEKIWMYYATDLTYGKQHLDEDEFIEVKEYTMDEMIEMIINQKIIDGKTIAMTLKVKMMLEKGLLPYPKKFKK